MILDTEDYGNEVKCSNCGDEWAEEYRDDSGQILCGTCYLIWMLD